MTSSHLGSHVKLLALIGGFFSVLFLADAQQIGSFNTVIYLNGAALSPSQISCSGNSYCCSSGQSCAWDDAGEPACCAWPTCTGAAAAAGQYQQTQAVVQTQTVYESTTNDCGCETTTTPSVYVAPAVVVPQTSTTTIQQYYAPTGTTTTPYLYTSTLTTPTAVAATDGSCAGGYTTVTEVNVGQPTRIVGCYVIINGETKSKRSGWYERHTWLLGVASIAGLLLKELLL